MISKYNEYIKLNEEVIKISKNYTIQVSKELTKKGLSYRDAQELVKNYREDGYDNWRLPLVSELKKIYKKNIMRYHGYWSSLNDSLFATYLNGLDGEDYECDKYNHPQGVIAVRDMEKHELSALKYNL